MKASTHKITETVFFFFYILVLAECRSAVHCWCFSEPNNKRATIKLVLPQHPNGKGTLVFVDSIHIALRLNIGCFPLCN